PPAIPEAVPAPNAQITPAPVENGAWQRARQSLATWPWQAALALGTLVLVVVLTFALRSPGRALTPADQPLGRIGRPSPPAGAAAGGGVVGANTCAWKESQPIGRRRGEQPGAWVNVGYGEVAPALSPEVVVTLEEVNFCKGQVTINWLVRNNMDDESVALPLTAENVSVSDSLGNEYPIADGKSQPPQISVAPRSKMRGTAVIDRPASLNAQTLVIKLTKLPFGEATWIVPI